MYVIQTGKLSRVHQENAHNSQTKNKWAGYIKFKNGFLDLVDYQQSEKFCN